MRNTLFVAALTLLFLVSSSSAAIHLPPAMRKSPSDLTYVLGNSGNTLIWAFEAHESADHPTTYTVSIDDNPVTGHTAASWMDNVDIVVNVDGLNLGNHNVKITVNDNGVDSDQAVEAVDTAVVTVISETSMSTTTASQPTETSEITETASQTSSTTITGTVTATETGTESGTETTTSGPNPDTSTGDATVNFGYLFSLLALLSLPVLMKKRK